MVKLIALRLHWWQKDTLRYMVLKDAFSPIAKLTIVRLFLGMVVIRHWPLHQLEIKNAFLHGYLEEEIYMEQPPRFVAQGEYGLVCKLRGSLYGLKQLPSGNLIKMYRHLD